MWNLQALRTVFAFRESVAGGNGSPLAWIENQPEAIVAPGQGCLVIVLRLPKSYFGNLVELFRPPVLLDPGGLITSAGAGRVNRFSLSDHQLALIAETLKH